jgi:hypothetical protein
LDHPAYRNRRVLLSSHLFSAEVDNSQQLVAEQVLKAIQLYVITQEQATLGRMAILTNRVLKSLGV